MLEMDLGKNPFKKFTKSALVDMIEDMVSKERERTKPMHKRGESESKEKDDATRDADEAREDNADLVEEQRGSPKEIPMVEEDFSDEAEEVMTESVERETKKKKAKAKPKKG